MEPEFDFMTPGFWEPVVDESIGFQQLSGGVIDGPLSKGGRPVGSRDVKRGGTNKNENGLSGHYAA